MASHKVLSNWYRQLAEHLDSGTRLAEAFTVCAGPPSQDRLRMGALLIEGGTGIEQTARHGNVPEAGRPPP